MSVFLKVPGLDWMKEAAEEMRGQPCRRDEYADRVMDAYKYLLWSHRYQVAGSESPVGKVALAMLTKYHHRIHGIPASKFEEKLFREANVERKRMLREAVEDRDSADAEAMTRVLKRSKN